MISILSANTYYFSMAEVIDKASFVLSLYSDISKTNKDFQVNVNPGVTSSKYYPIVITQELIDEMNAGEYNYTLKDGDLVASKGLLRIIKEDTGEYDTETDYVIWGEDVDWVTTDMVNSDALWQSGYTSGYTDASHGQWEEAYSSGYTDGYASGYSQGYADGVEDASEEAFESGYTVGYQDGYESGSTDGYQEGFDAGYDTGYEEGYQAGRLSIRDFFSMKALTTGATIGIRLREQTSASTQNIQYSLDKLQWHDVDLYNGNIPLESGLTIYFKGNNPEGLNKEGSYVQFITEGLWEGGGDLTTLLNEVGGLKKLYGYKTYYRLFDSTNIVTAPDLSIEETDMYSYYSTFNDCRYLKNVPTIRINNLISGTFRYTFVGCTSLESVTLYMRSATGGYDTLMGTFRDCTSLSSVTSYFEEFHSTDEEPQTHGWLDNVAPTGHFNNLGGYQFEKDSEDGIPVGWTEYIIQEPTSGGSWESGYTSGWTNGYESGSTDGFNSGWTGGYSSGVTDGEEIGYNSGYTNGYSSGATDGFNTGYASGTTDGKEIGYQSGWTVGYNSGATDGFESGYQSGTTDGFETGYSSGRTDGYDAGIEDGYSEGYRDGQYHGRLIGYQSGFTAGYESGSTDGYNSGLTIGYNSGWTGGYQSGRTDGEEIGYTSGYTAGYSDGVESVPLTSTMLTANGTYTKPDGGWNEVIVNIPEEYKGLTFHAICASTITLTNEGGNTPNIKYSLDNVNWVTWDYSTISISAGNDIYFKGINNKFSQDESIFSHFAITGNMVVYGNIMSLVDDGECTATTIASYCFEGLFYNCTGLTDAGDLVLPAMTLSNCCYERMFYNCISLTTAPELPATTLASECYIYMFYDCASLASAPALPATTLEYGCYNGMFELCISLTTAPVLPATTLAEGCYLGMFAGCENLSSVVTYATDISAAYGLIAWLDLVASAGTFYNYGNAAYQSGASGIPNGWTEHSNFNYDGLVFYAIEDSVINLSKSQSASVYFTFNGNDWIPCGASSVVNLKAGDKVGYKGQNMATSNSDYSNFSITSGKVEARGNIMSLVDNGACSAMTIPNTEYFYGLFSGSTALVSAPELPALNLTNSCYSHMFDGCTSLKEAPELPATTLAQGCYSLMFRACSSLIKAPTLPSTTLANNCYYGMFQTCSSLSKAPVLPAPTLKYSCYYTMFYNTKVNKIVTYASDISATSCLTNWLSGVPSGGNFYNLGGATYPSGVSGIPSGWTEHRP